jgi:hypothetical protein
MQYLVSGYANWYAKRHRRPDHLTQGRFKAALVEDESYFWTVNRHVPQPGTGEAGLGRASGRLAVVKLSGYARRRDRVEWVAYEAVYSAWQGEMGGSQPEAAYRRFVEKGLATMPEDPFREAVGGWRLGSRKFVDRVRAGMTLPRHPDAVPAARRLACYDYRAVLAADSSGRSHPPQLPFAP